MMIKIDAETLEQLVELAWEASSARKALFGDSGVVSEALPRRCNEAILEADVLLMQAKEDKAA